MKRGNFKLNFTVRERNRMNEQPPGEMEIASLGNTGNSRYNWFGTHAQCVDAVEEGGGRGLLLASSFPAYQYSLSLSFEKSSMRQCRRKTRDYEDRFVAGLCRD